ncbi:flagellar basal body-associated protein FliL [Undibacterium sp. Di24W]|uniref:flagellar basal body-associated protein FliL n=1 Tax=Undibacterium sp. Di24W TaxID=3413033 RepID=UPI003BF2E092
MSKAPEKPAADAPAGKSKKKLFIIIGVAVLLLGAIGGGAVFMLSGKKNTKEKEHKEEVAKAPVFLPLEPFVVNLQSDTGEKYLQVQMTLQIPDEAQSNLIKSNTPQVKSRLIMLLSSKDAGELLTPEGKDKLIKEITEQVNLPFTPKGDPQKVSGVFFTSFVIQ